MSSLYSLQLEKQVLGGLLKKPEVFAEVAPFLNESDFFLEVNATIFAVLKNCVIKQEVIDPIIVAEKIKGLNISFKDGISILDYIEGITFTQIQPKAIVSSAKELIKLRICRELEKTGKDIQSIVQTSTNKSIDEIIGACDKTYNERVAFYELDVAPINLFENVEQIVEDRGREPLEETGYPTQFTTFNNLFGGLRPKNLYAFVSRPGQGKSTLLVSLGFGTSLKSGFKIPFLLLDTEMESEDVRWRMVSSLTDVPMWYLETGNWRNNASMVDKVRAALQLMKDYKLFHYKVGNKNVDEVCSVIRRWYYSHVGRGNKALIAYDYIKLTGEKVSESWKEYQAIGEKVDKLKKISEEINCPLLVAMQLNRLGENFNKSSKDVTDDSSAIALSDRLQWFSTYVGIFRRKTVDEMQLDGIRFGSHKCVHVKTRFQGREASGHQDIVKRTLPDGTERYENNYLNFDVTNFKVEEKGSLKDIVTHNNQKFNTNKPSKEDDGSL